MKRWRRIILITAVALMVLVLGLTGTLIWLQSSGRLTRYAQELVQEHSGQNLSFESVAFASWNTVALTNVRLQQTLPGWALEVFCPRVEARYTLQGLRRRQVASVRLIEPIVHLQTRETPVTSNTGGETPTVIALPVRHIQIRHAALHVEHGGVPYTFRPLEVTVRQMSAQQVRVEAQANFDDHTAHVRLKGRVSLDLARPTGTFDISLDQIDVTRLTAKGLLPPSWGLTKGTLKAVASQVELRGQAVQGSLNIHLEHGQGDIAAVTVQDVTMAADTTFEANLANRMVSLKGPMQLQTSKLLQASSGLVATQLTAQLPLQLTYTPAQWHIHTDLQLQGEQLQLAAAGGVQLKQLSQTASIDAKSTPQGWSIKGELAFDASNASIASMQLKQVRGKTPITLTATPKQWKSRIDLSLQSQALRAHNAFQLRQLSSRIPLDIDMPSASLRIKGTVGIEAQKLHIGVAQPNADGLAFERVQGQLPIHFTSNALRLHDVHIQAKTVRWQPGNSPITSPLDLRTSANIHVQRQQAKAENLVLNLPNLGRIEGRGTWQWATGTAQDVHLSVEPASLETIWPHVAAQLPAPYPTWLISGRTQIDLSATHTVWRHGAPTQPLSIDWRFSDVAFSSPEGDYAGENINGQLQANVSLTPNWRPASVQASFNLKPFALLIGSFFPELEQHNITSAVTLNTAYDPQTGRVDLKVDSQFGPLGRLSIEGKLDTSQALSQAHVTCRLRQINVTKTWQTFMPEGLRQANRPPTMQGRLNADLQLRGTRDKARVQGGLQLAAFHLQTGSLALRNLSLQLPVDVRYPLPTSLPNLDALPASAYGQLRLDHLQLGSLQLPGLTTSLAVRSDSLIFQKNIEATLLKGVLHIQDLVAYHMLQPQRQLQLQMRLRSLNLQHLQRGNTALPIAGQVDADFSRLHFQHGRLQTEGSLQLRVAGGRIRVYDVAGWDLLSQIPSIRSSLKTENPLSLYELTKIYPIGEIGGTLHVTVDDLTITAGEPAAFVLHFRVQRKGGEAREISLRALNNLVFTTGSAQAVSSFTNNLRYRRFGAEIVLQHDTLRLRGLYKDRKGIEYFMRAPALGGGVSIVNRTPQNGIPFRQFVQRLKATVLEGPNVRIK
ncbi:MAG: hypothetical protein ETSY1_03690 [Candidatus Entotheonella factor]|uniref:AsmA-like C-terminal domain-containing protein n=1 Tax=Entotheonella factor TaxID=1429438 RepID=W4LYG2_ENTF1|nr:hypothetical protein [Candidatus Entotheonella palauensis]ETX02407.1 MAG: hypothetical protein ETSY1_03690 [Candidatus Entotheonella factor]